MLHRWPSLFNPYAPASGQIRAAQDLRLLCEQKVEASVTARDPYNPAIGPFTVDINIDSKSNKIITLFLHAHGLLPQISGLEQATLKLSTSLVLKFLDQCIRFFKGWYPCLRFTVRNNSCKFFFVNNHLWYPCEPPPPTPLSTTTDTPVNHYPWY